MVFNEVKSRFAVKLRIQRRSLTSPHPTVIRLSETRKVLSVLKCQELSSVIAFPIPLQHTVN